MLFDIQQFEQYFKEKPLKKGLRIFEKDHLDFEARLPAFEYHFSADGEEVVVKKKGDKLLAYTCSCSQANYCEHLAAVLFHFQQEALALSVKPKKAGKPSAARSKAKKTQADYEREEQEALRKFISAAKDLSPDQLQDFLSDKRSVGLGDGLRMRYEVAVAPYLRMDKLNELRLATLLKEVQVMDKKNRRLWPEDHYLSDVGLVSAFIPLFRLRFSGDEHTLFSLYHRALQRLEDKFREGLNTIEKKAWARLTLFSVESNKHLLSEAFLFLIPRYLVWAKDESQLSVLTELLSKRKYKASYAHQLDSLMIARQEVAIRQKKLFDLPVPPGQRDHEVEMIVAGAELDFSRKRVDQAFAHLEASYEFVKGPRKIYYREYLAYLCAQAKKYGKKELEVKYLKESFLHSLFILPEALERFLTLIPQEDHTQVLYGLCTQLKTATKGYYFDKISLLLLRGNMLDELAQELGSQHNKFSLVHELALRKFPDINQRFLLLYMRHLGETLKEDSVYNHQVKIFNTAQEFLNKFPEKTIIELIKKLLDLIGKTGHLYRYINELYDYPFLREETNY